MIRDDSNPAGFADRVAGALYGHAVGDCLGATTEFCTPAQIGDRYGTVRDIVGGGAFGWRPGQGTDDTDLSLILCDTYTANDGRLDLDDLAARMLAWHAAGPRDVGGTTATALRTLRLNGDPTRSGAVGDRAGGNGSLMRTLAVAIVQHDNRAARRRDAAAASAITHAHRDCIDACVAYCDLVAELLHDTATSTAIGHVIDDGDWSPNVTAALHDGSHGLQPGTPTSGWVIHSLTIGVAALVTAETEGVEHTLVDIVNRGGDADTNAAIAGGLLGARHGLAAVPERWVERLEQAGRIGRLAGELTRLAQRPHSTIG